jgi:hypothetical protein
LKAFKDPKSDTFGNYYQCGLKAGYSEEYSANISSLMPSWLSENIGTANFIIKAERNLDMALDGLLDDPEKGPKNIQYKATEFALKTQGKERGYSERTEHTGANGERLIALPTELINKYEINTSTEPNNI